MKNKYIVTSVIGILLISFIGCSTQQTSIPKPEEPTPGSLVTPSQEENEIKTDPFGVKYIVDPDKIVGGGPPKDGIPSIDDPKFVSLNEADDWIEDNELVLGIIYKDIKRVYPLQIMVWHEIVNDIIAGDALLITY
jgi:hypothetical protein